MNCTSSQSISSQKETVGISVRDFVLCMYDVPISSPRRTLHKARRLEKTHGLAHGGLDMERLDVLPVLLQQRDEEVDGYTERV